MGHLSPLALHQIGPVFYALLANPVALAVSGGADSMALMHLVAAWHKGRSGPSVVAPIVLTVDHRLRAGSADEAAWIAGEAARLGLAHATLAWTDPKPVCGLQAAARAARYGLLNDVLDREFRDAALASKRSIVTAHHADDQAETFLMRLARGSGLDGLSGMRPRETIRPAGPDGTACTILRPLLRVPKARLIATLQHLGAAWREDPSNASTDFERVRVREALRLLEPLGVTAGAIARSTRRLARARSAVAAALGELMPRLVRWNGGLFAQIDAASFLSAPDELQVRALAIVLESFGGISPPARLSQIEALVVQMSASGRRRRAVTLGGCRIERDADGPILVWRESGREGLEELDLQPGARLLWDKRFAVALSATEKAPVRVRALRADGVRALEPDLAGQSGLQSLGVPRAALETLPSFWRGGRLVAVPYFKQLPLGTGGCSAELVTAPVFSDEA